MYLVFSIHVKSPAFAGRLLEIYQISCSPGKENQSPGFSVKPKQFFFYVIFRSKHGVIGLAALYRFSIGCISPRVLCTKCYKASDSMFAARKQ